MVPLVAALIKWGLPLVAGAVASKGQELVQEKLGIDLSSALGSEEGRLKLKQMEMENQQFLVNAAQASEVRDLEYFKEEVADRSSARLRDAEFLKNAKENWRAHVMFTLAIAVICWMVWIIWKTPELNEYVKGIFTLVLGRFLGYLDNIYNFEFGTTRASRVKDNTIERLSK